MNAIDKAVSSDITPGQLLDGRATAPEAPLMFLYEGQLQIPRDCVCRSATLSGG